MDLHSFSLLNEKCDVLNLVSSIYYIMVRKEKIKETVMVRRQQCKTNMHFFYIESDFPMNREDPLRSSIW